ncbi:MAG: S9 family peptidase, partial [Candidatus Krumholzibacteria bacterium]|nr:S9 family peptidase [Candidatus Krumholzibacteria bacterium]
MTRFLHVAASSVFLFCVLFPEPLPASDVLTVDRFVSMTRCADPQVSPDGRSVLFTVTEPDLAANRNRTDIRIVPLAGGEPRRFAGGAGAHYHPRWSPDGTRIAFVSTRGGSAQIWVIPAGGGEAERLTDLSTGANDPVWSPDGKFIAFYSFVHPDCPDDSCNAAREKAREEEPVKARVIDNLLYRHWDTWKEGRRNHLFIADAATGEARDLTPLLDQDFPTFPWGGSGEYCFSPDGREILVVSKDPNGEAVSTNTDIYAIDLESGAIRRVTDNPAADDTPSFSPDGRRLAWRAQA